MDSGQWTVDKTHWQQAMPLKTLKKTEDARGVRGGDVQAKNLQAERDRLLKDVETRERLREEQELLEEEAREDKLLVQALS